MEEFEFLDVGTDWEWMSDSNYLKEYGVEVKEAFKVGVADALKSLEEQFNKVFSAL